MLITLLRKPWQADWQPAEIVTEWGYPMTLPGGRIDRVASQRYSGRARWLRRERSAADTWEHAKPLLRNPVKRRVWAHPITKLKPPRARLAGLSALARFSMLAEPQWPSYALSPALLKAATQAGVKTRTEQLPDAHEWQRWHYSPALIPDSETVDPLSLTLSRIGRRLR